MIRKTLLTRFDALTRLINGPELVAVVLQIMCPSPESRRNFQNRAGWQAITNTRKDGAGPLRGGTAPRRGPFLARLFPIVLHGVAGTITHSSKYGWLIPYISSYTDGEFTREWLGGEVEPPTRGFSVASES